MAETGRARICLFGGSFDPVHAGHLQLAHAAQQLAQLDELLFLPAACSPFKQHVSRLLSDEQRLALLRCVTKDIPWAQVSEIDLQLPPPSWSWRVVENVREQHPEAELFWLMGVDQWELLPKWARYDYLCEQLCFIVYHRDRAPQPRDNVRSIFLDGHHPASSSAMRSMLQEGKDIPSGWLSSKAQEMLRQFVIVRQTNF